MIDDRALAILGALAERLIPTDETPGADAAWARAFVRTHLARHPEDTARYRELAAELDSSALAVHGLDFDAIADRDRDAILAGRYPTLVDAPELRDDERDARQTMRELMTGFLIADELDLREDPYSLDAAPRDRTQPSGSDYTAADSIPDLAIDRRMATNAGRGTYARVWRAAGYATPPGHPLTPEEIGSVPALVTLRTKK